MKVQESILSRLAGATLLGGLAFVVTISLLASLAEEMPALLMWTSLACSVAAASAIGWFSRIVGKYSLDFLIQFSNSNAGFEPADDYDIDFTD